MPPKRKQKSKVSDLNALAFVEEGLPRRYDTQNDYLVPYVESTATDEIFTNLRGRRNRTRQSTPSPVPSQDDAAISIDSDDAEDNTGVRAEMNPVNFEKMFVPQPRLRERMGELQPDLEPQHPLSDGKCWGDIASSTLMPGDFRAQKGQVVMVDCVPFDRKPVGFEQVGWMMNGDACLLVETWKASADWVRGRRQFSTDKPGQFSGPIERWRAESCCLCEEHVLRSGPQNHFFGFFNANADYPNPFMVSWTKYAAWD